MLCADHFTDAQEAEEETERGRGFVTCKWDADRELQFLYMFSINYFA
jgi:hypothetical protein